MDSKTKNQLIGFTGCLSFFTFIAFTYIIWKGLDVAHCPMIHALLLPLWGVWLFCTIFDYFIPKFFAHTTNKWIIRGIFLIGLLFCLFTFYTCQKGIDNNETVFFNIGGTSFHFEEDCDEIDEEAIIYQSRKIDAERNGLHPCRSCRSSYDDFYED